MQYVIIGTGIAGVCAAEAIRSQDPRGRITMIGDETFPPYSRPMISHVLEGVLPHDRLPIRPARFYDDLDITPMLGRRADGIDVDSRQVRVGDAGRVDYDRLLITSGYPLALQVDETAGRMIRAELVRRGLTVKVGVSVRSFEGDGSVRQALTDDGRR